MRIRWANVNREKLYFASRAGKGTVTKPAEGVYSAKSVEASPSLSRRPSQRRGYFRFPQPCDVEVHIAKLLRDRERENISSSVKPFCMFWRISPKSSPNSIPRGQAIGRRPRVQFPASRRKTLFGEAPNTTRGTRNAPPDVSTLPTFRKLPVGNARV